MKWLEFRITTSSEAAEVVAERLAQMGAAGIATQDPQEMRLLLESDDDTAQVDPTFAEELPEDTFIRAYFASFPEGVACRLPDAPGVFSDIDTEAIYADGHYPPMRVTAEEMVQRLKDELAYIGRYLDAGPAEITFEEVDELSWRDKWKQFYHPMHLSKRLFVAPSWEEFRAPSRSKLIRLDPGSAFGTGSHETTQLCAEKMDSLMSPRSHVLDLGTGSGILAIGAAKLGARHVTAMDISEHCVEVCRENVRQNQVEEQVDCVAGELKDDHKKYDLIMANLIAEVLIDLAPEFPKHMNDLALLICSGIVGEKKDQVLRSFRRQGFKLFDSEERNDWWVLVFSHRPNR